MRSFHLNVRHLCSSIKVRTTVYRIFKSNKGIYCSSCHLNRVWKGILGIRDLTKIRCGIRENEKYLDGIRDLTATREAGFAKIWARDAGFLACLSGIREIVTTQVNVLAAKANQPGERKISIDMANFHHKFISFC